MFGKADGVHYRGKHADSVSAMPFKGWKSSSGAAEKIAAAKNNAGHDAGIGESSDFPGKTVEDGAVKTEPVAATKHFAAEFE
jgi:hypothetical protein